MFCAFFAHEGFSDGSSVRGISCLYVLKAIMGKIGLSPKEARKGTSKNPEVVTVHHFFIFWPHTPPGESPLGSNSVYEETI